MPEASSPPVVAIDGPAGSGKTTVARRVARALGFTLVDTGAIYRCVALQANELGIPDDEPEKLRAVAAGLDVRFEDREGGQRVLLSGRDVSDDIRTPPISERASRVSAEPAVREALLHLQRDLGRAGGVVLEGRDIGTVVFPDAEVKVFLQAPAEVRARRRYEELRARGIDVDLQATISDQERRDRRDTSRDVAPMKPAPDAVVVDTGPLSVDEVTARIVAMVERAMGGV